MYCISFTNYNRFGKEGWQVILKCAELLNLSWRLDNCEEYNELDSKCVINTINTFSEVENYLRNTNLIFARLSGYHSLPATFDLRSNIERGICPCAIFCTDQSCFEIYSADKAIILLFVEALLNSEIEEFEVGHSIARTTFDWL